ncbi:MAG: hypothetical protein V7754_07105 [Halioglobus sp.]
MRSLLLAGILALLWGCSGSPDKNEASSSQSSEPQTVAVGDVNLRLPSGVPAEYALLDIGLVIFDPGIPKDPASLSKLGIFPEIRKAEARYLPYLLRRVLVDTQAWGAVRVLPKPDATAELQLTGKILVSDGSRLSVHIRANDASGRVWLDRAYTDVARTQDYPVALGGDPYIDLYRKISNDLLDFREKLSQDELARIRDVSLLQYAASLSPDAFAGFVTPDEEGNLVVRRLPAEDDPMLGRVQRIKNQEYLFIDNADEQYQELYDRMTPTYNLWRQNGRELAIYKEEYEERVANKEREGRRGTFAAMQQTYNAYSRSKEHDQDLDELAQGFNNEVAPTVMEVEGKVFRLNGSLESQYNEWRAILRSIFALETGLPPVE